MGRVLTHCLRLKSFCLDVLHPHFVRWMKPLTPSLPLGTLADLGKSKPQLVAENAFLRQQLIILSRQVKRPVYRKADRMLLVLLARLVRTWEQALLIVQPNTLLRWHRELFRLVWKRRSKAASHTPKIAAETVTLIREMAAMNRLWGAERIRGELLKLGIHVCKRTIQKYMRRVRSPQPRGQKWATFLRNHAAQVWACDFLQVTDLFFRPLAGVLHHRTQVEVSDPRGSDTISHRSMGCAYRSEKPRRMGKLPGISFVITIASLGPVSSEWHQRVPLKCSERLITLPEPMRSANAF